MLLSKAQQTPGSLSNWKPQSDGGGPIVLTNRLKVDLTPMAIMMRESNSVTTVKRALSACTCGSQGPPHYISMGGEPGD